jgi:hypothetical protein
MYLSPDATPVSNTGRDEFHSAVAAEGTYHGYPPEWFTVIPTGVVLNSRIASRLRRNIEEGVHGWLNINAPAQRVIVNGIEYDIYPGFWCSSVPADTLR